MNDESPSQVGNPLDMTMAKEAVVMFGGKQLNPFNAHRLYAANCMGLRVFNLSADQQAAMSAGDCGSYDGALFDLAVVLYLCASPTSVALRALRLPSEAVAAALSWADANKLLPGTKSFDEAAEAFSQLLSGIFDNDANQEVSPEDTELWRGKGRKKKP